jgi:hypothetical protein
MVGREGFVAVVVAVSFGTAFAADLTDTEQAWLEAAMPVLGYAREQRLPLDIVVQPQPTPGQTPLGMAFVDGRCKLVLSMRGNPDAQATLDRIPKGLLGPVVEAVAAHELGHCWRHVQRRWGTLPADLQEASPAVTLAPAQAAQWGELWRTRREEGYADLVGLAWTLQRHPTRYAEVQAWHVAQRAEQPFDAGPHDTRVWVQMAGDPSKFTSAASIFEQAEPLWRAGLLGDY